MIILTQAHAYFTPSLLSSDKLGINGSEAYFRSLDAVYCRMFHGPTRPG